tara:strand:- start:9741 stop:10709 length:969 start_codon:yes stop_codon:yes gene_type:complete
MSKEITIQLLKLHINRITDDKLKRKFLLNCIEKHGLIKKEEEDNPLQERFEDFCRVCKSNSKVIKNNTEVCEICGTVLDESINPYKTFKQNLNIGKLGSFISPDGTNRDLSRVNTWVNTSSEEKKMQQDLTYILNKIDSLESEYMYNPEIFDKIRQEIIEMWFHLILKTDDIRGNQKKSLAALIIYSVIIYNGLKITIQRLSRKFEVDVGSISSVLPKLKKIMSDNEKYIQYVNIRLKSDIDLKLTPFLIRELDLVKRSIRNAGMPPPGDNGIYGIIYAISKKASKKDPFYNNYNLPYLYNKTGVSTTTISRESKKYEKFIK